MPKALLAKRELIEPSFLTGPNYVYTYGPLVAELSAAVGFAPDPQQEMCLDRIFGVDEFGRPASYEFAVICCRQNLKTGLFKQAALGWLYITEEKHIVWSAHELPTALEAQRDLVGLIEDSPMLSRRLPRTLNRGIYEANGQARIEFRNGQRLVFRARTLTGGRGLTGDKVILDEAFALQPSHVNSVLPTMVTRPNGQVLYGSSAGGADDSILRDVRDRGRAAASPRMTYVEWSAPRRDCATRDCAHPKDGSAPGCALDDVELRRMANPALSTGRITLERLDDLRQALPPDGFARECLGWWEEPEDTASRLIHPDDWVKIQTDVPPPDGVRCLAMVFSFDDDAGALAGAVKHESGVHLELLDSGPVNVNSLTDWIEDRWQRYGMIALAGGPNCKVRYQELRDRKIPRSVLRILTTAEVFAANAMLETNIITPELGITIPRGAPTDALEASVKIADKKVTATGWRWVSSIPDGDIKPMEALSVALWASKTNKRHPGRKVNVI